MHRISYGGPFEAVKLAFHSLLRVVFPGAAAVAPARGVRQESDHRLGGGRSQHLAPWSRVADVAPTFEGTSGWVWVRLGRVGWLLYGSKPNHISVPAKGYLK